MNDLSGVPERSFIPEKEILCGKHFHIYIAKTKKTENEGFVWTACMKDPLYPKKKFYVANIFIYI